MNVRQIILRLAPFVKPYKSLVSVSFFLTLIGAIIAQINPLVLRYTVDTISQLLSEGETAPHGFSLLFFISAVLFGKELANIAIKYGQSMLGERIRINLSSQLSQYAVERILTYKYVYFAEGENATDNFSRRSDREFGRDSDRAN